MHLYHQQPGGRGTSPLRAAECANTLQPRRASREGCLQRRRASVSPPPSLLHLSVFPSTPAKLQLPRLDLGPRPHVRGVLYGDNRKISWRRLASIATLRHLPHIVVSPRPRELHTSHIHEYQHATPPPQSPSVTHAGFSSPEMEGLVGLHRPSPSFRCLLALLCFFLFLPPLCLSLLPSNSHHRLGEA